MLGSAFSFLELQRVRADTSGNALLVFYRDSGALVATEVCCDGSLASARSSLCVSWREHAFVDTLWRAHLEEKQGAQGLVAYAHSTQLQAPCALCGLTSWVPCMPDCVCVQAPANGMCWAVRQALKLQAEVLGPLHSWSVGFAAAQKKVEAMRRQALELDSRRRTVIELNTQVRLWREAVSLH